MTLNAQYTLDDHEFRPDDPYADAKYSLSLRWLTTHIGGELLNIGCGSGVFNELAADAGFRVCGIEPDALAYERALQRAGGRYAVEHRGLFDLGPDDAADVVVMHDVLEHIDAEDAAVAALKTVVRPGGVAVVSVPALDSLFGYHDTQLGHFRRYTRTSLRRCLSTRFDVLRVRYFGFSMVPVAWWFSKARRRPYPTTSASAGWVAQGMRAVCAVEQRVPGPIGTSVLAMVTPHVDAASATR